MRVLLVNNAYWPSVVGGAERSVGEIADHLIELGHDVHVVCLTSSDSNVGVSKVRGVNVTRLKAAIPNSISGKSSLIKSVRHIADFLNVKNPFELWRIVKRYGPDVVHMNNIAGFGWLTWLVVRKVPTVQTVRDYSLICTSATGQHDGVICNRRKLRCKILKSPFTLPFLRPTVVVGVSEYVTSRMKQAGVIGSLNSLTVLNLPTIEDKKSESEELVALSNSRLPYCLSYLGRLDSDKGLFVMGAMVRQFHADNQGTSIRLKMAGHGDPDAMRSFKSMYAKEIMDGVISISGPSTPSIHFRHADAVIVPTQWQEPYGRVAAEAYLLEKPVIHSDVGGLPEVARQFGGRRIRVEEYRSPRSWAAALKLAIDGDWETVDQEEELLRPPWLNYMDIYKGVLAVKIAGVLGPNSLCR